MMIKGFQSRFKVVCRSVICLYIYIYIYGYTQSSHNKTYSSRLNLWKLFIVKVFIVGIDFEKCPKKGEISPKSKGVNLNFLTIFEIC